MADYIAEMYKMVEFLSEQGKPEWVDLLHGMIIYIEENEEVSETDSESDTNYSEEEGNAIPEGVPEVYTDADGFKSLV